MDATALLRALLGEFVRTARRQEGGTPSVECHFKRQACEGGLVSAVVHLSHTAEPGVETLPQFFRGILASDTFTPSLVDASLQKEISLTYSGQECSQKLIPGMYSCVGGGLVCALSCWLTSALGLL